MHRRHLLMGALAGASAAVTAGAAGAQTPYLQARGGVSPPPALPVSPGADVWASVRAEFNLSPDYVDLSAMLLASHPRAVREAVATYRDALDRQPVLALKDNRDLQNASRLAVAKYLGARRNDIALTDSTTSAVALVFNGLKLSHGDEILTVNQDYYVIHESARYVAAKRGAKVRRIALYGGGSRAADADQMVERVIGAIRPETRVLALTWVHSSTGVKLPIGRIAEALRPINAGRPDNRRIIFCVDGAHGFGNQDAGMPELGCDFLMSGCHKWLFGPRGTGMIAGSAEGWAAVDPTIPSFLDSGAYSGWISGSYAARATGSLMTPGGFKPFEHLWALSSAFDLHNRVGRPAIAARTAELAGLLKEGIAALPNATLHTPMSSAMSAGIVSFDVAGMTPAAAVERLRDRRIMASMAPYARQLVRLTPSIRNTPEDLEAALREVRALG